MMRARVGAALVVLAITACKDSSTPTDPTPTPVNAAGTWSGTTGQGLSIRFTVGTSGVNEIVVSWMLTGTSCSVNATVTRTISPAAAVQNNAFSLTHDLGSQLGAVITMAGTFQSSTAAQGTLRVDDSVCKGTTNTTWTATK